MPLPSETALWSDRFFGPLCGEIYRRHLLPPERTAEETEFVENLLGRPRTGDGPVLDLACGFGRHARLLARRRPVVALDLNLGYLREARRSLRGATAARMAPVRADMRALPFADARFSAVLFLFNSFGYFEADGAPSPSSPAGPRREIWKLPEVFYRRELVKPDFGVYQGHGAPAAIPAPPTTGMGPSTAPDKAAQATGADPNLDVLREAARLLAPGAPLLIEAPNPAPLIEAIRREPRRHVIHHPLHIEEEFAYDEDRRTLRNRTRFRLGRREEDGEYTLRLYTRAELAAALKTCGLKVTATYGDYDAEPCHATRSGSILMHAVAPGAAR